MAKHKFTEAQQQAIQDAIAAAELNTSGEIRVHIASHCKDDPMQHAVTIFEKLEMHHTEQRNGVLFYVAMEDHKLAILGDKGINDVVPPDFWDGIRNLMVNHFKTGDYTTGLVEGISKAGFQLKVSFPYFDADKNELSNEISFQEEVE